MRGVGGGGAYSISRSREENSKTSVTHSEISGEFISLIRTSTAIRGLFSTNS